MYTNQSDENVNISHYKTRHNFRAFKGLCTAIKAKNYPPIPYSSKEKFYSWIEVEEPKNKISDTPVISPKFCSFTVVVKS